MDRDMVNCLHYLYQWGDIPLSELRHQATRERLFWCGPDTKVPIEGLHLTLEDNQAQVMRLIPGVFNLIDSIESQLRSMPKPDFAFSYPFSAAIRLPGEKRPAFLAISYDVAFEAVKQVVLDAANESGFVCEVTGDLYHSAGTIMDQVWQGIRAADVVVADITGNNANVFYEIGLAHALGKEVILITQDKTVPFDIRANRHINYDRFNLPELLNLLKDAFNQVSPRYPFEGSEPRF